MCNRIVLSLSLTAAIAIAGCARPPASASSETGYRTITTQPLRDTDAAQKYNQTGVEYLTAGKLDQAEAEFSKALTADVEYGPAHNNLGKIYYRKRDWYKAAWEFEYARKLLPKHAEPCNNLGLVLEEAGQLDQAVEQYREAVRLDPVDIEYRANLVRALIRRGDKTPEVRGLLQQVLAQDRRPEWQLWANQQLSRMGD